MNEKPAVATRCARAGANRATFETPPTAPPIYQSAVFNVGDLTGLDALGTGERRGFTYSRDANPTVQLLEEAVRDLESAEAALAAASGMGAIAVGILGAVRPGEHIIAANVIYGRTVTFMQEDLAQHGIETTFADIHDLHAVRAAIRPETTLIFAETISNPLMRVPNLIGLAEIAHDHGARLMLDATFSTPFLSQPLSQGADIVVHSGTKYLCGHSDVLCGVLVGDGRYIEGARNHLVTWGMTLGPFDAWLTLRGLKTLALRMERACDNALAVARFLASRPDVQAVHYPGIEGHPDRALATDLFQNRFGAMVGFELPGGRDAVNRFIHGAQRIPFAPSLADTSTTLSHPATTSHGGLSEEERAALGISDGLIRLSVGIEAVEDIIDDLRLGLDAAAAG